MRDPERNNYFENIKERTTAYRRWYPLWLLFAVVTGIASVVTLQLLGTPLVIPVWQAYFSIITTLVFLVSIPYLIYVCSQHRMARNLLATLVVIGSLLSVLRAILTF